MSPAELSSTTAPPVPLAETSWRVQLQQAFRNPLQLLEYLQIPVEQLDSGYVEAQRRFRCLVPYSFAQRMQTADINDPLLKQVLPVAEETIPHPGFGVDPVADAKNSPVPGIIHKYHGRVLLITTGSCAVNCRYCFRREYDYQAGQITTTRWQQCLDYIRSDSSINEVIFSGGEPLLLSTDKLQNMTDALQQITHLKRLRIHTRLPVVIPARVNERLCQWLQQLRLPVTMVMHINHPNEINREFSQCTTRLRGTGCTLLNQAVLLKSINADALTQIQLSEKLYQVGLLPYYLNCLDKVAGAAHFWVNEQQARAIWDAMRSKLPGYLLPRLVQDTGSSCGKMPL